jgi:hypothetical protein
MDGVLVDLLNAKWNAFVKFRYSAYLLLNCCVKLTIIPAVVQMDIPTTGILYSTSYVLLT